MILTRDMTDLRGVPEAAIWVGVVGIAICAYLVVFTVAGTGEPGWARVLWAIANALPHVLLAIPLVDRVAPRVPRLTAPKACLAAATSVVLYAAAAYCCTVFLLALTERLPTRIVVLRFFAGPALPWQMLQGTAYGTIAIVTGLWLDARRHLAAASPDATAPRPQRWLVKTSDGIVAIDPADIVRIEGAGEYSRLVLPGQSVLSRIGIGECEARLCGHPFLRVHRSHLVQSDAIVRAEPAGNGRLQLTLRNGDQVVTSREGARRVRATAV
jgi:two-component system, LytTR family, response regulator